jgi:hypothetical protein
MHLGLLIAAALMDSAAAAYQLAMERRLSEGLRSFSRPTPVGALSAQSGPPTA